MSDQEVSNTEMRVLTENQLKGMLRSVICFAVFFGTARLIGLDVSFFALFALYSVLLIAQYVLELVIPESRIADHPQATHTE